MPSRKTKRGEKDRELDPVLARALERLNRHMADREITQTAVAERAGLTQGHVSRILAGGSPEVSFYLVARIAVAAKASIDLLVGGVEAVSERPPASSVRPSSG